jgi:hypothetical protein
MATTSIEHLAERACEAYAIHIGFCRYRRQGLVCSTCTELHERRMRLIALWQAERAVEVA